MHLRQHKVENSRTAIIAFWLVNGMMLALLAIPLFTGNRRIAGSSMFALIVVVVILYATSLNISGLTEKSSASDR